MFAVPMYRKLFQKIVKIQSTLYVKIRGEGILSDIPPNGNERHKRDYRSYMKID